MYISIINTGGNTVPDDNATLVSPPPERVLY